MRRLPVHPASHSWCVSGLLPDTLPHLPCLPGGVETSLLTASGKGTPQLLREWTQFLLLCGHSFLFLTHCPFLPFSLLSRNKELCSSAPRTLQKSKIHSGLKMPTVPSGRLKTMGSGTDNAHTFFDRCTPGHCLPCASPQEESPMSLPPG